MKELTKEIVKDYGTVAVEGAKAIAVGSIVTAGSIEVITDILAAAYTVGCRVLRYTPEGKAFETAARIIGYAGTIGGMALGVHIEYKLGVADGIENALEDLAKKRSKDSQADCAAFAQDQLADSGIASAYGTSGAQVYVTECSPEQP